MLQTTTEDNHFLLMAGNEHPIRRDYWDEQCEVFTPRLASYANRLTNHRTHDAEDLVHDTYCRALAHLRNPLSIKNPQAYLLRMMRNVWIDRWKKENRANVESLEAPTTRQMVTQKFVVTPTVLQSLERQDLKRQFILGRGRLTKRETQLLEMLFAGKTTADIASELCEDVKTIRADVNAMRNKIRYRLKFRHQRD